MMALGSHKPAVPSGMGNNKACLMEEELVSLQRLSLLSPAQPGTVHSPGK